ncbi:MAG: ParB/Srx family N-terminal domain-containing protein [Bacillota bacterium]
MQKEDKTASKGVASGIPVYCAFDELADIGSLKPHPRNPNRHPESQIALLAKIIKAQGWRAPITVSNRSGYIVRGHGRLLAAQLLGVKQVPVDRQDYASDEEELADLIADNRVAELAEMDRLSLAELLREIEAAGLDLEIAGFTKTDMAMLVAEVSATDASSISHDDGSDSSETSEQGGAAVRCPWCGYEFVP